MVSSSIASAQMIRRTPGSSPREGDGFSVLAACGGCAPQRLRRETAFRCSPPVAAALLSGFGGRRLFGARRPVAAALLSGFGGRRLFGARRLWRLRSSAASEGDGFSVLAACGGCAPQRLRRETAFRCSPPVAAALLSGFGGRRLFGARRLWRLRSSAASEGDGFRCSPPVAAALLRVWWAEVDGGTDFGARRLWRLRASAAWGDESFRNGRDALRCSPPRGGRLRSSGT